MKKATIIFMILLGIQVVALASEHAGTSGTEHEAAVPAETIMYQAINLGILLIGLFFAVRKSVVAMFKARYENYNDQAAKTAEASKAAEVALSDIKNRIQNLQSSESATVATAKKDAEALKNKMIQEAQAQAEKMKADTKLIVAAELSNAKDEIRKEIINASIEVAKSNIKKSAESITQKSEKHFLDDIAKTKNQVTL